MANRKLNVGVTIFLRKGNQSLWENGIFQNCYFLLMLLNRSPIVERAFLVNGGDGTIDETNDFQAMSPAPVIDMNGAMEKLDVIIELSAQLNADWAVSFKARGGKIVGMHVANDYAIDIERMVFNLPNGMLFSATPYDVVWTLPAFEHCCRSYYEAAFRTPVKSMQHLWGPTLLERSAAQSHLSFAYAPAPRSPHNNAPKRWRIGVFEPNVCMVKTSHLPMLLVDQAHRTNPHLIECLRVYNAVQFKDEPRFVAYANSLDIFRHGISSVEGRFPLYQVLGQQVDVVVSHHWQNGQNYLYYEALYGGYPLVHNSAYLDNCGYRYADFDCEEGALALAEACTHHDLSLDAYKRDARRYLEALDPESEKNVQAYSAELERLYA